MTNVSFLRLVSFIFLFLFSTLNHADSSSDDKSCPTYIQVLPVISENSADTTAVSWIPQAIADSLPIPLRPTNVRVVTSDTIKTATQDLAKQQANGGGNDNSLKNLARSDFIVTAQWMKMFDVKHVLTLKLKTKSNDEIAMRSMDVHDIKNESNAVDAFVRKAARDFGMMLTNRFYCIKIDPKEADLSAGDKKEFQISVENLKGQPISGETVTFTVNNTQIGTVSPNQQTLTNGATTATYQQIKSDKNKLKAAITPKQFLSDDSYTYASIEPGKMTLIFKTDEVAEAHEGDGAAKARVSRLVEIPLTIDRKTKQVSGHAIATHEPWINSMQAFITGGKDWGHSAPRQHEDVSVSGSLINDDTTLRLTVHIKPIEPAVPAAITATVDGETFHFHGMAHTGPDENINVDIAFQLGAIKEKQIHQNYPGVVLYGTHTFKLIPYEQH